MKNSLTKLANEEEKVGLLSFGESGTNESKAKKIGYGKYYATITGAFSAGNAMAYLAYGVHGLFDAIGIDFITLGFTLYEQLKMKQENDKIDKYISELQDLNEEEKVGLLSFGESGTNESKANFIKKI